MLFSQRAHNKSSVQAVHSEYNLQRVEIQIETSTSVIE